MTYFLATSEQPCSTLGLVQRREECHSVHWVLPWRVLALVVTPATFAAKYSEIHTVRRAADDTM